MNGQVTEPRAWSWLRLVTVTLIAAAVQAGLIYWASDRNPIHPRTAMARPSVQLAALAHNELLTLTDPTIFSRAHPEGFSGPAWLALRVQPDDVDTNTAPQQQWLALASARLGENFRGYVRTNPSASLSLTLRPHPPLTQPTAVPDLIMAAVSTVELKDALTGRTLINFPPPPPQTNADILLTSEVQLLVDARGNPISAVLLRSSGIKTTDQLAVSLARNAQFTPARDVSPRNLDEPDQGVITGRMIFHWHTVSPPPAASGGGPNPR